MENLVRIGIWISREGILVLIMLMQLLPWERVPFNHFTCLCLFHCLCTRYLSFEEDSAFFVKYLIILYCSHFVRCVKITHDQNLTVRIFFNEMTTWNKRWKYLNWNVWSKMHLSKGRMKNEFCGMNCLNWSYKSKEKYLTCFCLSGSLITRFRRLYYQSWKRQQASMLEKIRLKIVVNIHTAVCDYITLINGSLVVNLNSL